MLLMIWWTKLVSYFKKPSKEWIYFVDHIPVQIPTRPSYTNMTFDFRYSLKTKELNFKKKPNNKWSPIEKSYTDNIEKRIKDIEEEYLAERRDKILKDLLK